MRPRRRTRVWLGGALLFVIAAIAPARFSRAATPAKPATHAVVDCSLRVDTKTHTLPPYPAESQRLGEQGTTRLKVTIGRDGVPTLAALNRSSGSARLDQAANDWIRQTWRWMPVDKSCAANFTTLVDVVWDLRVADPAHSTLITAVEDADYPPEARAAGEEGIVYLDILMGQNGAILSTTVSKSSGFPDLDNKAMQVILRHAFHAGQIDGHPVLSTLRVALSFRLDTPQADAAEKH